MFGRVCELLELSGGFGINNIYIEYSKFIIGVLILGITQVLTVVANRSSRARGTRLCARRSW
jgi:hypothetical protein